MRGCFRRIKGAFSLRRARTCAPTMLSAGRCLCPTTRIRRRCRAACRVQPSLWRILEEEGDVIRKAQREEALAPRSTRSVVHEAA